MPQRLSDLAAFHAKMTKDFKLPSTTKWICFGGSYPGALSAWFRIKVCFQNLELIRVCIFCSSCEKLKNFFNFSCKYNNMFSYLYLYVCLVLGMTLNCTEDSVSNLRLLYCFNLDNSKLR